MEVKDPLEQLKVTVPAAYPVPPQVPVTLLAPSDTTEGEVNPAIALVTQSMAQPLLVITPPTHDPLAIVFLLTLAANFLPK